MAVNMAGVVVHGVVHIVSAHAAIAANIAALRASLFKHEEPPQVHSVDPAPGVTRVWEYAGGGTSGLLAVHVALGLGYDNIILAGIPMDNDSRFYDPPGPKSYGAESNRDWWIKSLPLMNGKVRSCSGWTRSLLGEPRGAAV